MSGTASRQKGKAGERAAVNYLKELGFADARRRMQSTGWAAAEVECIDSLPNIHFEVKYKYSKKDPMKVGSSTITKACAQSLSDCNGKQPVVLWVELGCSVWKLTYQSANGIGWSTVAGDDTIRETLNWLNEETRP